VDGNKYKYFKLLLQCLSEQNEQNHNKPHPAQQASELTLESGTSRKRIAEYLAATFRLTLLCLRNWIRA